MTISLLIDNQTTLLWGLVLLLTLQGQQRGRRR